MRVRRGLFAGLLTALCACGRAIPLSPPESLPAEDVAICEQIAERLPGQVIGEYRLSVAPDVPTTAAWGSPPITWRCGVSMPVAYEPTSQVLEIDGILWFPQELGAAVTYTTVQEPHIEVSVPKLYPTPASVLTSLTDVLTVEESATPADSAQS